MKIRALTLVSSATLAMAASPAFAQSTETGQTPDTESKAPTDIIVTAPRYQEQARETQKNAPNLINVQSAETIDKYPDFNSAEALSRIPGVSLSSDTGEGRFVNIRGIDGNLNGATYGGVVLLNTNPGGTIFGSGREVEFDTIPTGAIDGIIVTKTGLPNHDAEGLGGTIELTPRSAANVSKTFVDGAVGYGYEPEHGHGGPLNLDFALGTRFGGGNKPFSFVITGSYREDRRGFDDIEEDYVDNPDLKPASGAAFTPLQLNKALADIQLRRYDYHRRRFGYGGEFAYTPNDDSQYYVRASIAGYVESVLKNRLTYDNIGSFDQDKDSPTYNVADALHIDPSNPNRYLTQADITIKGTDEQETHRNQVFVAGGRNRFGNLSIDYHGAYSRATFNVARNYGTTYSGPTGVNFAIDNITNSEFPILGITDPTVNVNDPTLYRLKKLGNSTEQARDQEWSGAINATLATSWIGSDDKLQFGGEVRLRSKYDVQYGQSFTLPPAASRPPLGSAITDYYDNHYSNGPQVNASAIRALAAASSPTPLTPDLSSYFDAEEDIYAGYAMYTTTIGKFGALAGVRVEATQATYGSYAFDQDGNNIGLITRKRDYTNVFPTVQLRYDFTPNFVARATYSTGIGRPGFSQVAQPISIDTSNEVETAGNPNLQPTTGDNFDLSLEYYLTKGGILSFGAFDKQLHNYIVTRTRNGTDPILFPGVTSVQFITYDNVPSAFARGIEAAYDQHFTFLPGFWSGFGAGGNITYVDSQVELRTGEKRKLPATADVTWNAYGFYEAHGVQLRLSAAYVGSSIFGIGDDASTDVYQSPRTTLDLTTSYELRKGIRLYFNVKNLTNEPLRYYEATPNRPIQREFYEETFEGGVKFKF